MTPLPPTTPARIRRGLFAAALLAAACMAAVPAGAQTDAPPSGTSIPPTSQVPVPLGERGYTVDIEGGSADGLEGKLEEASQLVSMREQPPASLGGLRRRAESDLGRLQKVLRSEGYYSGTVAFEIEPGELGSTAPAKVILHVAPGERYLFGDLDVRYVSGATEGVDLPDTLAEFGAIAGQAARAAVLVDAEKKLLKHLRDNGFPFAKSTGRKALANVDTNRLNVTTQVALGEKAKFGPLTYKGLDRVTPRFIEERLTWREGDEYDAAKVRDMRNSLMSSGLFNAVRIEPDGEVRPDGTLPMLLTAGERPARTVGAGVSYTSTEGFGLTGRWEHRNLLGEGQSLRLDLNLSTIEQSFSSEFSVPAFRRPDQRLVLSLEMGHEETDAYERTGGLLSAGIERDLDDKWTVHGEAIGDFAIVDTQDEGRERSYLAGLGAGLDYDGSNSLLDPTEGVRLSLRATPYGGYYKGALGFLLTDVEARGYLPLDDDHRLVLAGRGRLGGIFGARTSELPADKRFFAGGAGSVRGFEYQEIGPLDEDGDPKGGRSLAEVNAELRYRVMENIGIVPFVDGGTVSDSSILDFEEEMAWAGGLGFRYYTSFGPIGVDLAYPVSTPSDEDPSLKVYVKLGQAF